MGVEYGKILFVCFNGVRAGAGAGNDVSLRGGAHWIERVSGQYVAGNRNGGGGAVCSKPAANILTLTASCVGILAPARVMLTHQAVTFASNRWFLRRSLVSLPLFPN